MVTSEKRSAPRHSLRMACRIRITSPSAYCLPTAMDGVAANLTIHGMMAAFSDVPREWVERWQRAVEEEVNLTATVEFCAVGEPPPIQGRIVWTLWKNESKSGPVAYVGLLFQILDPPALSWLDGLLNKADG